MIDEGRVGAKDRAASAEHERSECSGQDRPWLPGSLGRTE